MVAGTAVSALMRHGVGVAVGRGGVGVGRGVGTAVPSINSIPDIGVGAQAAGGSAHPSKSNIPNPISHLILSTGQTPHSSIKLTCMIS